MTIEQINQGHPPIEAILPVLHDAGIETNAIDAVHPPYKIQEEMILSTWMDPTKRSYIETYHFITREKVDTDKLHQAILAVATQHPILRSIICWDAEADRRKTNLVWMAVLSKKHIQQAKILYNYHSSNDQNNTSTVQFRILGTPESTQPTQWEGHMPWKVSIRQIPTFCNDERETRLTLSFHHSVLDGSSARRLLHYIHQELVNPGSVPIAQPDLFALQPELSAHCTSDVQERLKQNLARIRLPSHPLSHMQPTTGRTGSTELIRHVPTRFELRADSPAVPAWMARLSLAMTLAIFQNTQEVQFCEIMSGRGLVSKASGRALGPILMHQVRDVQFDDRAPLSSMAQSFRSSKDIGHGFSLGQLRALAPDTVRQIEVYLVCQTSLSYPSNGVGDWKWAGVDAENDLPLLVELMPGEKGRCAVKVRYHQERFLDEIICSFHQQLCATLEWLQTVTDHLEDHNLVTAMERTVPFRYPLVSQKNRLAGADAASTSMCAHELIDQTARRFPGKIALQFEHDRFMTYAELADQSSRLASALRAQLGVQHSQPLVPICFDHGIAMVVSILAVLKAGAAYVPLDPAHPAQRLEEIILAAGAEIVLWSGQDAQETLPHVCQKLGVGLHTSDEMLLSDKLINEPVLSYDPSSLAYVLFTSGSTGKPKGVMIEHRNLVSFMVAGEGNADGDWTSTRLSLAAYTFDVSIGDIFANLWRGGRLTLVRRAALLSNIPHWLDAMMATHVALTPTVGDLIISNIPARLQTFMFGGEAFHKSFLEQAPQETKIWNTCGPTESVVDIACCILRNGMDSTPIGHPFGQCRINIFRPGTNVSVPLGAVGEICVAGPQVSRGYLSAGEVANRQFVTDPFCPGGNSNMYRTGDLGRLTPEEMIEHLGRLDGQVKLRGLRIEVGEVETVIKDACCEVLQVVVAVHKSGRPGGREALVAWLVFDSSSLDETVRQMWHEKIVPSCHQRLPSYMIPTVSLRVHDIPRNNSGKLDRRRLTDMYHQAERSPVGQEGLSVIELPGSHLTEESGDLSRCHGPGCREYVPPRNEIEEVISQVFANLLLCRVGAHDSFLRLGGDSILAIHALTKINKRLEIAMTLKDVIECPVVAALATRITPWIGSTPYMPISRVHAGEAVCQSFSQGRLWFHEQLHPDSTSYLMMLGFRVWGRLDIQALDKALASIEQRHEALRTTFERGNDADIQVIHPPQMSALQVVRIPSHEGVDGLSRAVFDHQTKPFNLKIEPGWRHRVFRLAPDDHVLSLVVHHAFCDGWSVEILHRELREFYSMAKVGKDPLAEIPPLPIQYKDFAVWQRYDAIQVAEQERQLGYWTKELEGSRPAQFLFDKPCPDVPSGHALREPITIAGSLHKRLQDFCKSLQVTPFVALLTVFRATHYRLTGSRDATVGTPIANRTREELKGIIGLFVNVQCIRTNVDDEVSFKELLNQTQLKVTAAFAHADVPFEQVVSKLDIPRELYRNPLISSVFAVHPGRPVGDMFEGAKTEDFSPACTTRLDLEVHLHQGSQSLEGFVLFSTDLYCPQTIRSMLAVFNSILEEGMKDPSALISSMPLDNCNSPVSRPCDLKIAPTLYDRDWSVIDAFSAQVAEYPDRIAASDVSGQFTYTQLDQMSDKLAHWLLCQQLPVESLVAVHASRSCHTITAFLGILKANLAYVPLDSGIPPARIEAILSSIKGRRLVLLDVGINPPEVTLGKIEYVRIADILDAQSDPKSVPWPLDRPHPGPTSLAYVMFTSGSTGRPKGVMIEHRGIVSTSQARDLIDQDTSQRTFAHMGSIGFDISTTEIYIPLLNGGAVVCIDRMTVLNPHNLAITFAATGVEVALVTPSLLKQCLAISPETISQLHTLLLAGERLDPQLGRKAQELVKAAVINGYGPTENTCGSTFFYLNDDEYPNGVPIGQTIQNRGAHVMDLQQKLVPPGVIGELVVTGDGLARGYIDSRQNAGRFVTVQIHGQRMRAYRTGDSVRARPTDGLLEFFGRIDDQVKIRGNRVELGEIECVIGEDDIVHNAAVLMHQTEGQDAQLVAFVAVKKEGLQDSIEEEQVDTWMEAFESQADYTTVDGSAIGRDFVGWNSMYDGSEIDKGEMNEWLDDTIMALVNGQTPKRIFEVGSGSGMVLFNMPREFESYCGIEPVPSAVKFVQTALTANPELSGKVTVHTGTATDIQELREKGAVTPDLALLNSVAQYFPSADYLDRTIMDLLQFRTVKTLFFGDMRSYPLFPQFQVSKALVTLENGPNIKDDLRRNMATTEFNETELLVDPAFFTSLPVRLPKLVHHVEILPKRMKATNELSTYRYAAVIHTKCGEWPLPQVHDVCDDTWVDYVADKMTPDMLLNRLRSLPKSESSIMAIGNIPNSKSILERLVVDALPGNERDGEKWLSSLEQSVGEYNSLSPLDLTKLAHIAGFNVEISWARQHSQKGGLDAIFHRIASPLGERVLFRFPTDHQGRPLASFCNSPVGDQLNRKAEEQIRRTLESKLPSYMVPSMVKVLDELPINNNGKVDRQALAQVAQKLLTSTGSRSVTQRVPPTNDVEQIICDEFARVLGVEVGITDDFFKLGGHSLMATRAAFLICKKLGIPPNIRDLFQYSSPQSLAKCLASRREEHTIDNGEDESLVKGGAQRHLRLYQRHNSRATIVLVHAFFGYAKAYEQLVPLIDQQFDIILVDDPFFGSDDYPQSLHEWSASYVRDIEQLVDSDRPLILGGWSYGAFLAVEMASIWHQLHGVMSASVLLLDPGPMKVGEPLFPDEKSLANNTYYGLTLFGLEQKELVEGHIQRHEAVWRNSTQPAVYHGDSLYVVTPDSVARDGPSAWKKQCSRLKIHSMQCRHFEMLEETMIGHLSRVVNEHCLSRIMS